MLHYTSCMFGPTCQTLFMARPAT
uniref:Uncharacterized protein n=1 Tax=Arundo donax TaxID=35708 RepID=A0A0A9A4X5_ARUDO